MRRIINGILVGGPHSGPRLIGHCKTTAERSSQLWYNGLSAVLQRRAA